MIRYSPRVLDASALVLLFSGHPLLMRMLDDAEDGNVVLLVPTLAIAEAETALGAGMRMWEHILAFRGLRALDLTEHTAIEAGRVARTGPAAQDASPPLLGHLTVGQIVYESLAMNAPVVTQFPDAYRRHGAAVMTI